MQRVNRLRAHLDYPVPRKRKRPPVCSSRHHGGKLRVSDRALVRWTYVLKLSRQNQTSLHPAKHSCESTSPVGSVHLPAQRPQLRSDPPRRGLLAEPDTMCDRFSSSGREPRTRGGVVKVPGDLELSDSDPEDPGAGPPLDAEVKELNSSSEDEEEVATVRCGRPLPATPLSNFSLKGGSSSFSFRSRNIFDCLDTVAKETKSGQDSVAMETASPPGKDGVAMETSPKSGQDSAVDGVFVRPSPPPPLGSGKKAGRPQAGRKRHITEGPGDPVQVPARRGAPDYLLHPERWTRYSLEEVAETSDSRNRSVALQYLLSLQQSKEPAPRPEGARFIAPDPSCTPAPEGSVGPSPHRIIFSRPGRGPGREERGDEGRSAADGGGRRGGLSHLEEEEEDLDSSPSALPPKVEQRKWGPGRGGGGGLFEEEEEEEEKEKEKEKKNEPQVPQEFASFRKAHRKNYRKTSEQEDE